MGLYLSLVGHDGFLWRANAILLLEKPNHSGSRSVLSDIYEYKKTFLWRWRPTMRGPNNTKQFSLPIGSKSTLYLKLKLTARSRGLPEIGPTAFAKPALSVLWKQRYPNFLIFFVFIHNMIISKIYKLFNLHFALLQPENDNPIDYYCNFHYFFIDKWWERIDIWFKIHMW